MPRHAAANITAPDDGTPLLQRGRVSADENSVSHVAITGAAGHIGRTLIDTLGPDTPIRAIDLAARPLGLGPNVEWVRTDVRNRASMTEALSGIDTVFHLAAVITISPTIAERAWDVNVNGAEAAARAALDGGVARFVHCSSIHAYDCSQGDGPLTETSPRSFASHLPVYDRSKAAGEELVRTVHEDGLDLVVVHPGGVIGPGDHTPSLMGQTIRRIAEGTLPGVVRTAFEWNDVRDVARALVSAAANGSSGRSYLLGGHYVGVDRVAEMVAQIVGVRPPRAYPMWLASAASRALPRLTRSPVTELITPDALTALRFARRVDDTPARTELGHRPRPIEETVADTVAWIRGGDAPSPGDRHLTTIRRRQ